MTIVMRDYHIKDPQVRQAEIIPVDEKTALRG